ncbi:hypothetical protein B9Z55_018698 [Caenorhabditis nigoni]|nr:hypothetical protein B9Z55_018698 [Caenorhabditis nigoni]
MLARVNQLIIVTYKILFFFAGIFGNACLIYMVAKKKTLQTKSSILQAVQSFCHIICLAGTQVDTVLTILDIQLPRSQCYPKVSIYTFFETVQSMIMLFLVIDILIIVKFPRFYHTFSTTKYIILALIPAITCGMVFFVWGFVGTNDEIVIFCNPPLGHKQRGDSWKVMKRLQLSVAIFVCSWFIAQSANSVFIAIGITGEAFNFLVANVSFFVLLSFTQTFYVVIWKSKEYRTHFLSMWCGRSFASRDVTGAAYLQCALCFSHIICLSFELPNAGLLFTGIQLKRNECFPAISIYIFFICAQAVIILMMTLDIFIIVFFPAFYQTVTTWKYLTGMLTIPVAYSAGIVIWGFLAMDDEVVMFCNPPLALYHTVSRFWTFSNVIINTVTLVLFLGLIFIFYYKGKKQKSDTRKIMKRLKVSILFFIFTWYIGLLAADLFVALGFTGPTLIFMMSNLVFFVLISYSQFFYVVIWRSPEYRNAFFEAWSCIPCCASLKEKHIMSTKISATAHSHQAASTVSST